MKNQMQGTLRQGGGICKIGTSRLILSDSPKGHPTDRHRRRAALSRKAGRVPFPNAGAVPRLQHTHIKNKKSQP